MDILIEQNIDKWVENHIGNSFKFRPHQKEAIVSIVENIVSSNCNHNHVIEAPTGSGKSLIVMISAGVLAEYYDLWAYILCSDLYLWDQYDSFIKKHPLMGFGSIKGQTGNYTCLMNGEDMRNADCRMGKVSWASLFDKTKAESLGYPCARNCEYVQARKKAIKSPVCLTTYQMFLYQINVVTQQTSNRNSFQQRPIIFCDECHNIPDIVQGKMTPVVQESDFNRLYELYEYAEKRNGDLFAATNYEITSNYTQHELTNELNRIFDVFKNPQALKRDAVKAMNDYLEILENFIDIVNDVEQDVADRKTTNKAVSADDIKIYKCTSFLRNYMCHWSDFCTAISEAGDDYLIKETGENRDHEPIVTFNCTKEDWMTWRYLLSQATYRVMLSATVGGKGAFEENVGIKYSDEKESKYEVIPSTFDFTKSPVYFLNRHKMSFKEKERSFEALKPIVYKICEQFKGKKGIIQTGNYELARALVFYAPSDIQNRMLMYDGSKDKITVIKRHRRFDDTILVGPTLMEGVDLPDDDCRFIVILKVPYPSMKDKLVAEKMKLFPLWYNSKTSNSIIQGIGRGVRNEHDYCTTYILDGCFYSLYINTKEQYAKELQNRIKIYN